MISEIISKECDNSQVNKLKLNILFGIFTRGDMDLYNKYLCLNPMAIEARDWIELLPAVIMGKNLPLLKKAHKECDDLLKSPVGKKRHGLDLNLREYTLGQCLRAVLADGTTEIMKEILSWKWKELQGVMMSFVCLDTFTYNREKHRDIAELLLSTGIVEVSDILSWILMSPGNPDYELADILLAKNEVNRSLLDELVNSKVSFYCYDHVQDASVVLYLLKKGASKTYDVVRYFACCTFKEGIGISFSIYLILHIDFVISCGMATWKEVFAYIFRVFFGTYDDYYSDYGSSCQNSKFDIMSLFTYCYGKLEVCVNH